MSQTQKRREKAKLRVAEYCKEIASLKEHICQVKATMQQQTVKMETAEFGKEKLLLLNSSLIEEVRNAKNEKRQDQLQVRSQHIIYNCFF